MPEKDVHAYINKLSMDPSFKGCVGKSLVNTLYLSNTSKLNILDEIFMTIPNVIYTRKNFFLLDIFNEKIELIKSSGLLQYWHFKRKQVFESKMSQKHKFPKILTIERLNGCFFILMAGLILGFFCFLAELYRNWKQRGNF